MEAALGPLPPTLCCTPAHAHGGRHGALVPGFHTLPAPLPRPSGTTAAGPLRSGAVHPEPDVAPRSALQARLPWPPRLQPIPEPHPLPASGAGTGVVPRREPLPSWAEALPPLGAELARVDRSAADLILRLLAFDPARRACTPRQASHERLFLRGAPQW